MWTLTHTNIISGVRNTNEAHIKVKDTILLSVFSPRFPPPLPVSANRQLQASRRSESVKRDCIYSGTWDDQSATARLPRAGWVCAPRLWIAFCLSFKFSSPAHVSSKFLPLRPGGTCACWETTTICWQCSVTRVFIYLYISPFHFAVVASEFCAILRSLQFDSGRGVNDQNCENISYRFFSVCSRVWVQWSRSVEFCGYCWTILWCLFTMVWINRYHGYALAHRGMNFENHVIVTYL